MVDLFPTNLRVMAAALSLTFGRGTHYISFLMKLSYNDFISIGGALLGNLLFGFLIDLNCIVPIIVFSAMLFSK